MGSIFSGYYPIFIDIVPGGQGIKVVRTATPGARKKSIKKYKDPRRRRQKKVEKPKDHMSGKKALQARYKLCTFLSHSLQNRNVKLPKFVWSENGNLDSK